MSVLVESIAHDRCLKNHINWGRECQEVYRLKLHIFNLHQNIHYLNLKNEADLRHF